MPKLTKKVSSPATPAKKAVDKEKLALLQEVAKKINRSLGLEGRVTLGKDTTPIKRIETGLLSADYCLTGGIPKGRYTELEGEDGAGKTLLSSMFIKAAQDAGGVVGLASREEFDPVLMEQNGVDVGSLVFIDTAHGDKALEACTTLVEEGVLDMLVFDSIQSFGTRREAEGSIEDEAYGSAGAPQMWGRVMRRAYALANQGNECAYIGISQVRSAIGKFSRNGPPDPEPTQIRSIKHWKSISVQTKRGEVVYQETATGRKIVLSREFKLKCRKNKTGIPDRTTSYIYNFKEHDGKARGFDLAEDAFRMARIYEVLENKGAHYYHAGKKIEQGEANVVKLIRADEKLMQRIRGEVRERMRDEK